MRFLAAIVLLALAVAEAHHSPVHTLRGPRFVEHHTHVYDVEFNMTSGVPGLSTQVSKAVFRAKAYIYAKSEKNYVLKIDEVYSSGSVKAIESDEAPMRLQKNKALEDLLSVPIKFTMEKGQVTGYTLHSTETLESRKIKRSILRSLEMHVPDDVIEKMESSNELRIPVTYNVTKDTPEGSYVSKYLITVSPDTDYPEDKNVYNITRSDDFEGDRYPSHHFHHNFQKQGCPEVCRKDWESNRYGAGCPSGHEPHHIPLKTSFTHVHHLNLVNNAVMVPEIIQTAETHVANMYDQDMEVLILFQMIRRKIKSQPIEEPSNQRLYTDLHNMTNEIDEKDIKTLCESKSPREVVKAAVDHIEALAEVIVEGKLNNDKSNYVGEKLILLQKALRQLKSDEEFKLVEDRIPRVGDIRTSDEKRKVQRQIWIDMLPLIGTEESIHYVVNYIKRRPAEATPWEIKEILEALPYNIHRPNQKIIEWLKTLVSKREIRQIHMVHSAAHIAVARTIGRICGHIEMLRSSVPRSPWFRSYQQIYDNLQQNSQGEYGLAKCPEQLVKSLVREYTDNLKNTHEEKEITIYLETLAHIGIPEVLPVLSSYIYGTAENLREYSPRYIDFVKTVALYALHNVVGKYPDQILETVIPVFFNKTENPKVRNAAFGILIRAQPSLQVLQLVASESWLEQSNEVGSYVTSTMHYFGNSSLPCMQLTTSRIKKVLPEMKRFDIGIQHAQNLMWTYFDDLRDYGIEKRFEYTPSNESFIPTSIYKSLSYSTDSLRETLIQLALNVQGVTSKRILDFITDQVFNSHPPTPIPSTKEREIFKQVNIANRFPEEFRMTFFRRIFYSSSYYYFNSENFLKDLEPLVNHLQIYLNAGQGKWSGHIIKVFLPSALHSAIVARTIPYPVEFEMNQPLVLSMEVKSLDNSPRTLQSWKLHFKPSVYMTKLYTHQMKNLGDCKDIGVSHVLKVAYAHPLDLKLNVQEYNFTFSYKTPELPNKILTYISEASTYAGRRKLDSLPSSDGQVPIRTLPSPFKYEKKIRAVGLPPFNVEYHTENIGIFNEKIPRNLLEAVDVVVRKVLNAGWRYKSVNVSVETDSGFWSSDTEVMFNATYVKRHVYNGSSQQSRPWSPQWNSQQQWNSQPSSWHESASSDEEFEQPWKTQKDIDEDWIRYLVPNDIEDTSNIDVFVKQALRTQEKLMSMPHVEHSFYVEVNSKPVDHKAYIRLDYNHTYTDSLHTAHADFGITHLQGEKYKMTVEHVIAYGRRPNEFKYTTHDGKQVAMFVNAIDTYCNESQHAWENVEIVSKGLFTHESLKNIIGQELLYDVDNKYFLPETHQECEKHVREGRALSDECIKAIRERSIYNSLHMKTLWMKDLPHFVNNFFNKLDILLKHQLYHHMQVEKSANNPREMFMRLHYIDKFTDEPVFDVSLDKPTETVNFTRVPANPLLPLSSIYSIPEVNIMEVTNNTYLPHCAMMKKYIKTFDSKTYLIPSRSCSYVLSTHCAQYKYYAVVAKVLDPSTGSKEIHLYVGKHTIEMTPRKGNRYTVTFNGKANTFALYESALFDTREDIYAYSYETLDKEVILEIEAKKAGVRIIYDGYTVKLEVNPAYKGELCGLCSEFDGEILRENRGMDRCLYKSEKGFFSSAVTNKEQCPETPEEERICDRDADSVGPKKPDEERLPSIRRNIVQAKGDEICFSNLPVPVCKDNAVPSETVPRTMAFHCLPKRDQTARKLLTESKRRVLGELAAKSVDYEETVEVAVSC